MNYTRILKADISNGLGFRCTLWVTGCQRKCPGCFNEEAQNPEFGKPFDEDAKNRIFNELNNETCDGLSLMGGEPLSVCSDNRKQIISLCKEVKKRFPKKDIWLWTGYKYEDISSDKSMKGILDCVDVIVDGEFLQEKKDLSCPFRGSSNQRVIDVKKTLKSGKIVEMKFGN